MITVGKEQPPPAGVAVVRWRRIERRERSKRKHGWRGYDRKGKLVTFVADGITYEEDCFDCLPRQTKKEKYD